MTGRMRDRLGGWPKGGASRPGQGVRDGRNLGTSVGEARCRVAKSGALD